MKIRLTHAMAAMVTLIMLGVTTVYWKSEDRELERKRQSAFNLAADQITADLHQRLVGYELVLRGVKGFFEASDTIETFEYQRYISALSLAETRPGLQGVAVALRVPRSELQSHIANMRKAGRPNYGVRPQVDRSEYAPIVLIEPFTGRNVSALGFDVASNPMAVPALEGAVNSGSMSMTRRLALVQDSGQNLAACVMYVPIFSPGAAVDTPEQRRKAIIGWVSGPFRVVDLVNGLSPELGHEVALTLTQSEPGSPDVTLYEPDSGPGLAPPLAGALRASRSLDIGGRHWNLEMTARPNFETRFADSAHSGNIFAGVVLSFMLGWLVWMLGTGRERAVTLAHSMTKELRDVQLELESTLDAMPDLVFELDLEGRYHHYRTSRQNLLAAPPEYFMGRLVTQVLPEDSAGVCMEALREADSTGFSMGRQIALPLESGLHWFELSVARKQVPPGHAARFIMISRDITDRKLAELALEKSNAQLKLLETCVSKLNDIVVITEAEPFGDPGPRIVFVNDAFIRRTGYTRDEVIGKTPRILQGPRTQVATLRRIRESLQKWETVREEVINYTKSGEEFWLELVIVPVADETGWFTHWVAVERDITERKLIQDALVRSEQTLNEAQLLAQVGSYVNDLRTGTWTSSPALNQIFGIGPEFDNTVAGWAKLLAPGYAEPMLAYYQQVIQGDGKFNHDYEIIRPSDGQRRWVSALGSFTYDENGVPIYLNGTIQDITETKLAEQQLQSSLREKEALLKEVHHRVKNNLQVITSMLRMESARSDADATKSVLRDMQVRIRSMALLHESIYRAGTFAAIDLGAYLRQVATQSLRTLQIAPGAIELLLDLGVVQVGLDQAMPCGLIVSELLSNCLKHGFPQGRSGRIFLDLQAVDGAGTWHLCVRDDGVGLPEDFETRRQTSLGLQLVSGLAMQIGGELQIGPGASFCITFKVVEPSALTIAG